MISIRPATHADLPAILDIYNEAVLNTTASYDLEPSTPAQRAAWYDNRVSQGFPVLVAEADSAVIGFGSYGPFRDRPGYRFTVEHSLYVAPAWRGRGVGRTMLQQLVELARADGKHVMIGGIDASNAGSISLHLQLGFVEVGRLREVGYKFERWLDIVFLQLML
jgi:phosphinothricin acetyltransferase